MLKVNPKPTTHIHRQRHRSKQLNIRQSSQPVSHLEFFLLRVTWVSWVSYWCRAPSVCGQNTRKATLRWKTWPVSSPCRGTFSSTRRPCSSASAGRRTERATRKPRRTASNTPWAWVHCSPRRKRSETILHCWRALLLTMLSQMSAVGITENAKGDNKKFEIWCKSREEVYIVQVPDDILSFSFANFFW